MTHDHAAYMRRWRRKAAALAKAKVLREEAQWLEGAHANSAQHGYSEQYRAGFKAAAGWVHLHADTYERSAGE